VVLGTHFVITHSDGLPGLTDLELVDEYRLMLFPVILAPAGGLFDGVRMTMLMLTGAKPVSPGGGSCRPMRPPARTR
jgi:hypothetical protein